ncbi:MAG: TonB-dependent receptor [Melioribacter sp.]|uniref:TonB-dependent receptor n=1 Tax=Melioribacter sp. TaxID=2052167 RepID=UPI003BEE052E
MGKKILLFISFFSFLFVQTQFSYAAGRISGKVTDAVTGEALIGANIIIVGTSLGTASDVEGKYIISSVPEGKHIIKVSYIGYEPKETEVEIKDNQHIQINFELDVVSVAAQEVVITAQASGQNEAINKQLSSENIVNVVSSARIQELPDANAAESIGRLPGISLVRTGGQATQVVIRGLSPEYNQITINGVPVPSNESGDRRSIDMRMISSSSLGSIEVYKTNTPDMDAAVLGGTVNLGIRKASKNLSDKPLGFADMPAISFQAQGGYTDLTNEYNNYKLDLSFEKRYLDNRFGVFVQGIIQQQNLTSNRLDANYTQIARTINPDSLALTSLNLYFYPREEKRYNGTLTFDYDLENGNIALMNMLSQSKSNTNYYQQQYGLERGGNNVHYYVNESPKTINLISNILSYNQKTPFVDIDATLSHSYSENIYPDSWTITFEQLSVGTNKIDDKLPPVEIARLAHQLVDKEGLELRNVETSNSFLRQRDIRASIDFSKDINISDLLSVKLKTGAMYLYTKRNYDYNYGYGYVWFGEIGKRIVEAFPWLEEYGIKPETNERIFLSPFLDPDINVGTFLNGNYTFDNTVNLDYMRRIKDIVVDYGLNLDAAPTGGAGAWVPNMHSSQAWDYSGNEKRSAGYIMGTFRIGQFLSIMTGVRYQNLTTSYRANRFYNASASNPYPNELPHIDTTVTKTHGYWLPAVNIKFDPLPWLSLRGAYTNTLAYPNFQAIVPWIDVYTGSVRWNNVNLKPIRSENFDVQVSVYNNEIGLFSLGGFLKRIDDFVFYYSSYIIDPTQYEGLHNVPQYPNLNVKGYSLDAYYNNPNTVEVWGIEGEWQTHFWYLPSPLDGLVLNINYTHAFSEAKYPYTIVGNTGFPYFRPTYTDTTYTDRLINQPDDIVNVSLGWDYKDFSILFSMIYQSRIFNSTNYWNALRTDKDKYLRWDVVAKQRLPWYNIEVFLNLNNLNGANDTYLMRGNNFKDTDESYGLRAEMGFRVNFR